MTRHRYAAGAWTWGLIGVAALAVLLRLPHLTDRSLWYDEASSWQTAKFSLPELLRSVRQNVHMPLYYILLKGWVAVWGESTAALRAFSIIFGVLTVLAMSQFGRELGRASASANGSESHGRGLGLMVAGLVAVSPFQVLGSIEARMYSLGTALVATSSWVLLLILRAPRQRWLWWVYGATSAGFLYSHHFGLFSVAAQCLFLGLYLVWLHGLGARDEARALLANASATGSLVALVYLPGLALLCTQTQRVQQDYWIPELHWRTVWGTFSEFLVPTHGFDFPQAGRIVCAIAGISCVIVAYRGRRGDGLVVASALVPLLLAAAVSELQPVWVARYFRYAHLFLLTAVALAVWKVTRSAPAWRAVLIILLFAVLLGANVLFWRYLDLPAGGGIRQAVAAILAERGDQEMIVTFDHHQYFPAKYYVGNRAPIRLLPHEDLFWGWHLIRPPDLIRPAQLERALERGVWVLGTDPVPELRLELAQARMTRKLDFHYYFSLHRHLFVHHFVAFAAGAPHDRARLEREP